MTHSKKKYQIMRTEMKVLKVIINMLQNLHENMFIMKSL